MPSATERAARLAAGLRLPGRPISGGGALPLGLLLLALSSVFAFGNDRSQFYREGHHNNLSAETLTLAANLSAEHGFLGFHRQWLNEDGEREYDVYNRFPIGSYALVKLAILPFGGGYAGQVLAARLLMLAFFAAAAVLAYLALARLTGERWIALAATLWACSSYYVLHYADMVSAEASTNLFGVMLVFHGMVVHAQEGRFRQLLAKTAVAILLGWHVVALVAPFVLLGLASEAWRARRGGARAALASLVRSRCLAYGAFSVLVCALALGFNLANEYRALGGEVAPLDLPSFHSVLRRTAAEVSPAHAALIEWPAFLRAQAGGAGGALTPFALVDALGLDLAQPFHGTWRPHWGFSLAGAAATAAALAALRFLPCRVPLAALLLAGWCWTLAFRGSTALHEFEAMFHLGVPLVLGAGALAGLRRALGEGRASRALPALALAALALFAVSAQRMGGVGHDAEAAARQRDLAADAYAIAGIARGRSVLDEGIVGQLWRGYFIRNYWLAGSYLPHQPAGGEEEWRRALRHDYLIAPADFGGSLTPGNRRLFLYRPAGLTRIRASFAAREPAQRARFDVHRDGRTLTYVREDCAPEDTEDRFFLHVYATDGGAREGLDFRFREHGVRFGGGCMASAGLPDYEVRSVRTGQYDASGHLWEAEFPLDAEAWLARYASFAAREPALRARFDAHLDGRTLTLVREACDASDAADRFFVHVYAAAGGGREAIDFWFRERGIVHGGKCMASVALPDYAVERIAFGQYDASGHLWEAELALGDASE